MSERNLERETPSFWEFKRHWVTLVRPVFIALLGVVIYKYGHDFANSRAGAHELDEFLRGIESIIGVGGANWLLKAGTPVAIGVLTILFGFPLAWALAVRATTLLDVDNQQILWRRGVFAQTVTQIEIGEVVGVNVSQTFVGRLLGYGTVDIETRGNDRLLAHFIGNARGFAGLVLDMKHHIAIR